MAKLSELNSIIRTSLTVEMFVEMTACDTCPICYLKNQVTCYSLLLHNRHPVCFRTKIWKLLLIRPSSLILNDTGKLT